MLLLSVVATSAYWHGFAPPRCAARLSAVATAEPEPSAVALPDLVIREAEPAELLEVARVQLDVFMPPPDEPSLIPMLASMFEANNLQLRLKMRKRLANDLGERVVKGSTILVATSAVDARTASADAWAASEASGAYVEPDVERIVGTVDLSSQELELPTHGLADEALYLSHMAVDGEYRRQGLGRLLLRAAEARAVDAGAEAIYLHVERSNEAALQLYRAEEYNTLPESPVYTSFTSALKLQHREPLLLRKSLIG